MVIGCDWLELSNIALAPPRESETFQLSGLVPELALELAPELAPRLAKEPDGHGGHARDRGPIRASCTASGHRG